jgi:replication factor A1
MKSGIKFANKKFTSIKNDYEISLDQHTVVQPAGNDDSIPGVGFSFVDIARLSEFNKDDIVGMYTSNNGRSTVAHIISHADVMGIVTKIDDTTTIKVQRTQSEVSKRVITIQDRTANIELTLWGNNCESLNVRILRTFTLCF